MNPYLSLVRTTGTHHNHEYDTNRSTKRRTRLGTLSQSSSPEPPPLGRKHLSKKRAKSHKKRQKARSAAVQRNSALSVAVPLVLLSAMCIQCAQSVELPPSLPSK